MADLNVKPLDKDSDYLSTVSKMRKLLKEHGFEIEESSFKNPVKGVWSVHIRDKSCPFIYTNGKGATKEAALASGFGEFFERISCNYLFSDYYLGGSGKDFVFYPDEKWSDDKNYRDAILSKDLWKFYGEDLEFENLTDFNSGRDRICSVPFINQKTFEKIYFPFNILDNLYVSNGMAAGNTKYEARVQALSEIIERHVKFRIIRDGISLPEIPGEVLGKFPEITESVNLLKKKGFYIRINDASLGGEYPLVNINLINRDGGVFAAFGAHPFLKTAIERTLTELMQGRDTDQFSELKKPTFDKELTGSFENLEEHFIDSTGYVSHNLISDEPDFKYNFVDFAGDTKEQYNYLKKIMEKENKDIYIADYDHFGIYCCRIIIPGFSEIYPVSDLFENNRNSRARIREMIFNCDFHNYDDCYGLYNFIMEEEFDYSSDIFELTGVLNESRISLTEFLFNLSLSVRNHDDALMWFEMLDMESISDYRRKFYSALSEMAVINGGYQKSRFKSYLDFVYGKDVISYVEKVLEGDLSPFDVNVFLTDELSKKHRKMLNIYNKKGIWD